MYLINSVSRDLPKRHYGFSTGSLGTLHSYGTIWETGALLGGGGEASTTWPTANRAIFCPVELPKPALITNLTWRNGATVTANVDCGIYDIDGNLLVSTGSTAQSGASTSQTIDITDYMLWPGMYFLALALSTTSTVISYAQPANTITLRMLGVMQAATSFPLPSTVTFAAPASAVIPSITASYQTFF